MDIKGIPAATGGLAAAKRRFDQWRRIRKRRAGSCKGHQLQVLLSGGDPEAANWIVLGPTVGRGHRCPTMQPNRPVKLVLGYPLVKRFRELLGKISRGGKDHTRSRLRRERSHEAGARDHRVGDPLISIGERPSLAIQSSRRPPP